MRGCVRSISGMHTHRTRPTALSTLVSKWSQEDVSLEITRILEPPVVWEGRWVIKWILATFRVKNGLQSRVPDRWIADFFEKSWHPPWW
jgi:hypothetical protein